MTSKKTKTIPITKRTPKNKVPSNEDDHKMKMTSNEDNLKNEIIPKGDDNLTGPLLNSSYGPILDNFVNLFFIPL